MTRKHQSNEVKSLVSATLGKKIRVIEPRADNPSLGMICEYIEGNDLDVAEETGANLDYVRRKRRLLYGEFQSEINERRIREARKHRQEQHKKNSPQFQMLDEIDFRNLAIAQIHQEMRMKFNELKQDFYQDVLAEMKGHLENEMNKKFAQLRESSESGGKVVKLRRGLPKELKGGA